MIIIIIIIEIMKFVDREEELSAIRSRLDSNDFEMIVVYGRRRIGKTRLILEALAERPHIYYLAVEGDNIRHFIKAASRSVPKIAHVREDWESIFSFLIDEIVVIDEFPNLIKEDSRILSLLQRIVDTQLQKSKTKLILLGSSISMMKNKVLSYRSPLYGRRTSTLKLGPLKFIKLKEFFPLVSWKELVEIYGFAGGIPYYLEKLGTPFWSWLERELRTSDTFLKEEVDFLLKYEFTDLVTYKRILEAIAHGKNTSKEIRDYTGMTHSDITPYLRNLMEVELVKREVPVTESWNSKRGRYYLAENFLNFWFRFIQPNLSLIEEGIFNVEEIRREYPQYLGSIFEDIARQFIMELIRERKLNITPSRVGRWWRRDEEVDLVVIDDRSRRALLIEVKWSDLSERDVLRVIGRLQGKGDLLLNGYEKSYGIVARSAKKVNGLLVWDLRDFDQIEH